MCCRDAEKRDAESGLTNIQRTVVLQEDWLAVSERDRKLLADKVASLERQVAVLETNATHSQASATFNSSLVCEYFAILATVYEPTAKCTHIAHTGVAINFWWSPNKHNQTNKEKTVTDAPNQFIIIVVV